MQYTISMSTRMLVITGFCVFLLCVLLFLLGIELGKRFAQPAEPVPPVPAATVPATPAPPPAPALPAPAGPLAFPAPAAKP